MTRQVKCFICSTKGNKSEMIREEITKNNITKIKYYHPDCKNIKELNYHSNNSIYRKESKKHNGAKRKILESLINNDILLIDQNNKYITFDMDFMAIESPVSTSHKNKIPFIDLKDCSICVKKYKRNYHFDIKTKEEFFERLNISSYKHKSEKEVYYQHPCLNCPFNNLKYKHIFDIGLGKEGYYTGAIEILHTSKIKRNKILFCIENNIELIEIPSTVVNTKDKEISCERIWWKDKDGEIHLSSRYCDLFAHGEEGVN
jgi:hypothetical protein